MITTKKNQFLQVTILMATTLFLLMGCSPSPKNEKAILNDFIEVKEEELSFMEFKQIDIEKRQTNKEKKEDIVYATVSGTGKYADHEYGCILLYTYYEKGGWILEDVTINSIEVKNITRKSDEEIMQAIIENENQIYIHNMYISDVNAILTDIDDSLLNETYTFENISDESSEETSDDYVMGDGLASYNTDYSGITYNATFDFDISYNSTLSYSAGGIYYLHECYDITTGQWYCVSGEYNLEWQEIDNLENIVWKGTPNSSGYYRIGRFKKIDDFSYIWSEKSFDDDDKLLLFDYEMPYADSENYLEQAVIEYIDLIAATNIYSKEYTYDHISNKKYYMDRSNEGVSMIFDWDAGTFSFTCYDPVYSIISTTGEAYDGNGLLNEPDELDTRNSIEFAN